MCGIFAYLNYSTPRSLEQVVHILLGGLRRLEYRGYDSAGICVDESWGVHGDAPGKQQGRPLVVKKEGRVHNLEITMEALLSDSAYAPRRHLTRETHVGIAHTRWATHGKPCDRNSHPISSRTPEHEFVVVHNGLVTNFGTLKGVLCANGHVFETDTDTEVIPKLAKHTFDEHVRCAGGKLPRFEDVIMETMAQLEGAFALVFKSSHYPSEVVACKRGSPLIMGIRLAADATSEANFTEMPFTTCLQRCSDDEEPKEVFFSSDAAAVVEHTKRVVYLEDEDFVVVKEGAVRICNRLVARERHADEDAGRRTGAEGGGEATRPYHTLDIEVAEIERGGFEYFMLKEIFDQPSALTDAMRGRVIFQDERIVLGGLAESRGLLRHARRFIFIACGTSYYSAMCARPTFEELVGVPTVLEIASDFLDRQPVLFRDDVCAFVSQSGESADTLRALEYCKTCGAFCVGFTNTVGSSLARMTHCGAHINAGCEIGVASTKAYSSQCVVILLLALMLSEDSISKAERRREIIAGLGRLPGAMSDALDALPEGVLKLIPRLKDEKSILIAGRGYQSATCLEAALKIKELSYIHTEGILTGELKHGSLALVDDKTSLFFIATKDSLYEKNKSGLQQVVARGGRPILILSERDPEIEALASDVVYVPTVGVDCLQAIVNIVPFQLLAYHLALARGLDVDCPRNLAKAVTVE